MAVFENLDFYNILDSFADIGGFDIVLPFLLVFAVTYAILQKIQLFGEESKAKKINSIVSFVLALFLVSQTGLVEILQGFLPRVSMIVIVLLMVLLTVGVFTKESEWSSGWLFIGAIVAILAVLWAIGASAGWNVPLINEFTESDIGVLISLGIFILVIWLIIKEPSQEGKGFSLDNLVKGLKKGR